MTFSVADQREMAASVIEINGEVVTYHSHTGRVKTINAVIERGVQIFTGASESGVSEHRTRIQFLKADIPDWKRDDRIVDEDNNSYLLKDELDESDNIVVQVAAK